MSKRKSNKKVKLMICSILNRNGCEFGYYSLVKCHYEGKYQQGTYALREYGRPFILSKAMRISAIS